MVYHKVLYFLDFSLGHEEENLSAVASTSHSRLSLLQELWTLTEVDWVAGSLHVRCRRCSEGYVVLCIAGSSVPVWSVALFFGLA